MQKILLKRLSILLVAFGTLTFMGWLDRHPIQSASLQTVSVTLSNPRLSFKGALDSGNVVGTSIVIIDTTVGAYPSTSSAQLVSGDSVAIGEDGSLGVYTVASTSSESTFTITSALATADAGDDVISTQSATHTVRFTTANAIEDGTFRVLVPALADDNDAADGIPDGGYFDFGDTAPTVTCPSDPSGYTFAAGTAVASDVTIGTEDYHAFECSYTGTGGVGTVFDGGVNGAITIDSLINPAPKDDHSTGTADTYKVIVQHLDSGDNVVDSTTVSIGVIEAVRVTASVPAQITFQIVGIDAGQSVCGTTTGVPTFPAAVPFGEVSIAAFNNAAQALAVTTNAVNGFTVTAIENDQMGKDGGACAGEPTITSNTSCIADVGQGGGFSHTAAADWIDTTIKGFGYSLQEITGTAAFEWDDTANFAAKQFPATEDGSELAELIFSSSGPADYENVYVCYRVLPGTTTAAGDYENHVTYTATATF